MGNRGGTWPRRRTSEAMAHKRQAPDELERAKLEAMKELAYGASHEINNPLANISARARRSSRDERDPERRRALEAIGQQALRAHEMIADLMLFARPPKLELAAIDAARVVEQVAAELAGECRRREIELQSHGDAGLAGRDGRRDTVGGRRSSAVHQCDRSGGARRSRRRGGKPSSCDRRSRARSRSKFATRAPALRRRRGRTSSIRFTPGARPGGGWGSGCRSVGGL